MKKYEGKMRNNLAKIVKKYFHKIAIGACSLTLSVIAGCMSEQAREKWAEDYAPIQEEMRRSNDAFYNGSGQRIIIVHDDDQPSLPKPKIIPPGRLVWVPGQYRHRIGEGEVWVPGHWERRPNQ